MIYPAVAVLVLVGIVSGTSPTSAHSQEAAISPSVEVLKQARLAGYRVRKLRDGATIFCKSEAHVGTRFSTESCIDETQLEEFLLRAQSQRDEISNHRGTQTDHK